MTGPSETDLLETEIGELNEAIENCDDPMKLVRLQLLLASRLRQLEAMTAAEEARP